MSDDHMFTDYTCPSPPFALLLVYDKLYLQSTSTRSKRWAYFPFDQKITLDLITMKIFMQPITFQYKISYFFKQSK